MKNPMIKTMTRILSAMILAAVCMPAMTVGAQNAVQGKWKADKERDGEKFTYNMQIEKDAFRFQLKQSDGSIRFVAKGKVKLEKQGVFKTLTLHDIQAG
jgi:hypothetical protein